jgi:type I pantothenate kinase
MTTTWQPPPGFTAWDRPAWAAVGRGRAPLRSQPPVGSPLDRAEWEEVYVPLAHVIGLHLDAKLTLDRHLAAAGIRGAGGGPFIIGLAGSVAAGKSTCARALAALLSARPGRPTVEVVSTDGFLFPNAVLGPRNLVMRKGFPETYDHDLIADILGRLAAGETGVAIPRYSHEVYDIAGEPQVLGRPDMVILEGVNALGFGGPAAPVEIADYCALGIYLDAEEPALRQWFTNRFVSLVAEARDDPTAFYARWADQSDDEVRVAAAFVWEAVNLENLTAWILPTRWRADLVVHKGADHAVTAVAVRSR